MNKELHISFNTSLNEQDTETCTYGSRVNNPTICGNKVIPNICTFVSDDKICKKSS